MFAKNNKLWLRNIIALAAVSIILAVSPAFAEYVQYTQATLGDMSSSTDNPTYSGAPSSRTTIGLKEGVHCSINVNTWSDLDCQPGYPEPEADSIGTRTWTAIGSGGTIYPYSGNYTELTADDDPGSVTVKVTVHDSGNMYVDPAVIKTKTFTVIAPDDEDTEVIEWKTELPYLLDFGARLTPTTVSFGNICVEETTGEGSLDECWHTGLPESYKQESVSGGEWGVSVWNYWSPDTVGWPSQYIWFYRNHPSPEYPTAPCQTTIAQDMWVVEGVSGVYTENGLGCYIGTTTIANSRDGASDSKTYYAPPP